MEKAKKKCSIKGHENYDILSICLKTDCNFADRLVCMKCVTQQHAEHNVWFYMLDDLKDVKDFEEIDWPRDDNLAQQVKGMLGFNNENAQMEQQIDKYFEDFSKKFLQLLQEVQKQVKEVVNANLGQGKKGSDEALMKLRNAFTEAYSLQPICQAINQLLDNQIEKDIFNARITEFFNKNGARTKAIQQLQISFKDFQHGSISTPTTKEQVLQILQQCMQPILNPLKDIPQILAVETAAAPDYVAAVKPNYFDNQNKQQNILPNNDLMQNIQNTQYYFSQQLCGKQIQIYPGGTRASQEKSNDNDYHTYALIQPDLPFNRISRIAFKITSIASWIGVGFALKNAVINNKYGFEMWQTMMHGSFMVSANGLTWSAHHEAHNIEKGFNFEQIGQIILCQFNGTTGVASFKLINHNKIVRLQVELPCDVLCPCAVMNTKGDALEIVQLNKNHWDLLQ